MITTPLHVSAIVIAYNTARFVGEAIESILAQTRPADEIVVVDDGSTDETPDVALRYAGDIRLVRQQNAGQAAARNTGARQATGDLLAFLDADDVWLPHKLERVLERFEARPELDTCIAHVMHLWESPQRAAEETARDPRLAEPIPNCGGTSWVVRRSSFFEVGALREELPHADVIDWFLRAHERGTVVELLPDALALRRIHESNRSRLSADGSRAGVLRVLKDSLERRRG